MRDRRRDGEGERRKRRDWEREGWGWRGKKGERGRQLERRREM